MVKFSFKSLERKHLKDSLSILFMVKTHCKRTFLMRQPSLSFKVYLRVTMELSLLMDRQVLERPIQWLESYKMRIIKESSQELLSAFSRTFKAILRNSIQLEQAFWKSTRRTLQTCLQRTLFSIQNSRRNQIKVFM